MLVSLTMAESNSDTLVHCRGVTKSYGPGEAKVTALRGVDLDVHSGELLMLVGPSGCGKTTLISIIAAILDRDSGECEVLGCDAWQMDRNERACFRGASMGFVFQTFNLLPALTVAENTAAPLLISACRAHRRFHAHKNCSTRLGLGTARRRFPAN